MYAIIEIAGQQHKVQKDQSIFVQRLDGEEGAALSLGQVLLVEDGDDVRVGTPVLDGVTVSAKIVEHVKGDKVIVFKKKRRKGYRKKNGHRQYFTRLQIEGIEG
ncbi:MAG: 50S ribosomal protein L21 [Catalinimonas sp.]